MNKTNNNVVYFLGAIVGGLLIYLLWQNNQQQQLLSNMGSQSITKIEHTDGNSEILNNDSALQRQRLDKIENGLVQVIDKLQELSETQQKLLNDTPSQGNETKEESSTPVRLTAEQRQEKNRLLFEGLENRLNDTSTVDEAWSSATSTLIEDSFTSIDNLKVAESQNITCGHNLCKVETVIPKDIGYEAKQNFEFQMLLTFNNTLPRATSTYKTLADGSTKYIHYFERKAENKQ